MIGQSGFHRQTIAFKFAHLTGIAGEHFHSTRSTTRVSAATMKNVDTGIFKASTSFFPCGASIT